MAPSPGEIAIFSPLVIGVGVTICTIVIHAVAEITIVHFVRHERRLGRAGVRFWRDLAIVTGTALLALVAHLIEMTAWAAVFEDPRISYVCGGFLSLGSKLHVVGL